MKTYIIGNCLRGYFEGEFRDLEHALEYLPARFDLSYPSEGGRSVHMVVKSLNSFGFEQHQTCWQGVSTNDTKRTKRAILMKTKKSSYYG